MRIQQAFLALLLLCAFAHVSTGYAQQKPRPDRFLLVWAGDADREHEDFRYYLQPLTTANKVVVLDVRDPLHPRQVSEVRFDLDPECERQQAGAEIERFRTRMAQPGSFASMGIYVASAMRP